MSSIIRCAGQRRQLVPDFGGARDETKDGMSNHVLILLQDVTEQKKIEQEEDHSRVTYRSGLEETLELARTGLWTIEMEEGCEPRMYAGNSMKKLLGVKSDISPEECYRAWYDRIEPGYEEAVQASVDEMLSSGPLRGGLSLESSDSGTDLCAVRRRSR